MDSIAEAILWVQYDPTLLKYFAGAWWYIVKLPLRVYFTMGGSVPLDHHHSFRVECQSICLEAAQEHISDSIANMPPEMAVSVNLARQEEMGFDAMNPMPGRWITDQEWESFRGRPKAPPKAPLPLCSPFEERFEF